MSWLDAEWRYRKECNVAGAAAAATNYVVFFKLYFGSGTDGNEALTGGHKGVTAFKVYLDGQANANFSDIRFTSGDGFTLLDHFRDSYTAGVSALFAVEVADDLGAPGVDVPLYLYYGNDAAATVSNAADTFRRVIDSGVVLALPMNEGAGATCTDYSGTGKHGIVTNGHWVATGKFGNCLNFQDGDMYVTVPNIQPNQASIITYFYPTDLTFVNEHVFRNGDGLGSWFLVINGADKLWVRLDADILVNPTSADPMTINNWWTLGMTYDAVNVQPYLNGAANGVPAACTGNIDANAGSLKIGCYDGAIDGFMAGRMSGFFMLNSGSSVAEMSDLHAYYPQCSSSNLGSLYLRSYVNPEPQPSTIGGAEHLGGGSTYRLGSIRHKQRNEQRRRKLTAIKEFLDAIS